MQFDALPAFIFFWIINKLLVLGSSTCFLSVSINLCLPFY